MEQTGNIFKQRTQNFKGNLNCNLFKRKTIDVRYQSSFSPSLFLLFQSFSFPFLPLLPLLFLVSYLDYIFNRSLSLYLRNISFSLILSLLTPFFFCHHFLSLPFSLFSLIPFSSLPSVTSYTFSVSLPLTPVFLYLVSSSFLRLLFLLHHHLLVLLLSFEILSYFPHLSSGLLYLFIRPRYLFYLDTLSSPYSLFSFLFFIM